MKIRLDRIEEETFEWEEELLLSSDELETLELLDLGTVSCRGRLTATHPGFLLRANLSYDRSFQCVRCLRPTPSPVTHDVDLVVLVEEPQVVEGEREIQEQELDVLYLGEPLLDTRPLVVEQVQLQVPMKPLCGQGCAGICSRCGADLNEGRCDCAEEIDPRWEKLAALRSRLAGSS